MRMPWLCLPLARRWVTPDSTPAGLPAALRVAMSVAVAACACACVPQAGDVLVPTLSMHDALAQARGRSQDPLADTTPLPIPAPRSGSAASVPLPDRRAASAPDPTPPAPAPPPPQALITAPEVRMAWMHEWVDESGNRHFGGWVAIPLGGFDWVMGDGTQEPVAPRAENPALQP